MNLILNQAGQLTPGFGITLIDRFNSHAFSDTSIRLSRYEIIWIKSGDCSLDLNLNAYTLQPGSICLLAPGQVRKMNFSEPIEAIHFSLSPDFFYPVCVEVKFPLINVDSHHLSRPMIININPDAGAKLNEIIQDLQKEISYNHEDSFDIRGIWLKLFMMYLKRQISYSGLRDVKSRDMELATQFLEILAKDFATKKMVSDYASDLSVTPNYLNLIVKRVSGFPASHHIQQFLILEAKRQAIASVKSMKEIAYALGFDDIAHFSKFFKNKSGTNFTDFKKERVALQFQS